MKKANGLLWKRGLATCLIFVLAFILPATPLYESNAQAAEVKSNEEYVKEVRLFIKNGGTRKDAEAWCDSQKEDWKVLDGDEEGNLNSKASGALTQEVGVFLCYLTTKEPDEAITDLAVMNEKGNYSEGEYETLLKKQKESYIDMITNMRSMINEYKKNYENKTPMAVKSHDFLNTYREDDSGKLLGDFILTATDDELAGVLLQCNGLVVLTIQEKLAAACDTAKTTWLDRMVKLGSYDKLKDAFSKNTGSAEKALDMQFKEKANKLLDAWDDLHKHFENVQSFADEAGLTGATQEDFDKWQEEVKPGDKGYATYTEYLTLSGLASYKYGDKTLLDFFSKTKSQIQDEGIEILYPMAACLTDGQMGALTESLGIYQMIQEAFAASIVNNNDAGAMSETNKTVDEQVMQSANDTVEEVNGLIAGLSSDGEKISIYEGVDRDVFKGGVAVTTDAQNMSAGAQSSWTDIFLKNGKRTTVSLAMDVAVFGSAVTACIFALLTNSTLTKEINQAISDRIFRHGGNWCLTEKTINTCVIKESYKVKYLKKLVDKGDKAAKDALDELTKKAFKYSDSNLRLYNALKWGFAVFTVLLSVADIVVSAYTLYKYYSVEHLPIPHHMVDLSYSESDESSYVAYKSVLDQAGNYGDVNGGNARQWLALYYTRDKKAGAPILAPTGEKEMLVKTGSTDKPGEEYSPIHMFGTENVAQNLTFADGDNGFSYNDNANGTYVYFRHAKGVLTYVKDGSEDDGQIGTAVTGGRGVLIGLVGFVAGGFVVAVLGATRRKKQIVKNGSKS